MDKEQLRWLMEQNEQHQAERRSWHHEDRMHYDKASKDYLKSSLKVAIIRACLELTIIILLAIIVFL